MAMAFWTKSTTVATVPRSAMVNVSEPDETNKHAERSGMGREARPDPFDGFVQGEEQLRRTAPTQPRALGTAEPHVEMERSISYSGNVHYQ